MAQQQGSRHYYNFVAGLNTEAHEVAFPENASAAEENFELMIGGYRRRRYGVNFEQDNVLKNVQGLGQSSDWAFVEHAWRSVNGDANRNWIVQQAGPFLYFYDDYRVSFSSSDLDFVIDLRDHKVPGVSDALVASTPVDMAHGRGKLIVVSPVIDPLALTYDPEFPSVSAEKIAISERDFEEVEDGIRLSDRPKDLSDTHLYNLLNRGWKSPQITAFESDRGSYPAKNMIVGQGFRRLKDQNFADADGINQFSPEKLLAELFQEVSAPKGFFILNAFDTSTVVSAGSSLGISVASWTATPPPGNVRTVVINTAIPHGLLANDDFEWRGARVRFQRGLSGSNRKAKTTVSVEGTFTALSVTSTSITFDVDFGEYTPYDNVHINIGDTLQLPNGEIYPAVGDSFFQDRPFGAVTATRPSATAFYAGRAWYAGINSSRNASRIYYSQIVETPIQFGKCYQAADPTDLNISDIVATDGGVLVLPELGTVKRLVPYQSSLVVLTETGVWEINGGFRDAFSATSINVRKLSDARVYAPRGVAISDSAMFYAAADGLHVIRLDPRAGILVDENISEDLVQTLWLNISSSNWDKIKAVFDPVRKRVWWFYSNKFTQGNGVTISNGWKYDRALVFDTRMLAYSSYRFYDGGPYITGAIVPRQFCCTGEPVIKFTTVAGVSNEAPFIGQLTYSEFQFPGVPSAPRELTPESWTDWGNDVPAFLLTGAEVLQDASRKKQAPTIHIFMRRTETGFTPNMDGDLVPKNDSGCFMQIRWDWADDPAAGKWSAEKQVYKLSRFYAPGLDVVGGVQTPYLYEDGVPILYEDGVPVVTEDSDELQFDYLYRTGKPVIVTREKSFGMGRAINVLFRSEPRKPCVLLGWSMDFGMNTGA